MSDNKFTPNADLEKLGNQVRQFRNGRKWSQQKLSDVSGLAVRTISRIERGLMNPSYTVLATLVKVLDISFDSLFTSSDDQDIDIQEMIGLYRACSDQGRQLILTVVRAMARDLMAK